MFYLCAKFRKMIKEIHIQNFRCFESTWVSGFSNINLIGGLNNSGKTALLEALFLATNPNPNTLDKLKELRKEDKKMPWDSLFFNHQKYDLKIKLDCIDKNNQSKVTEFWTLTEEEIITNERLQRLDNQNISEIACLQKENKSYFHLNGETRLFREWLGWENIRSVSPFIATGSNYKKEQLADLYEVVKNLKRKDLFHSILHTFDTQIVEATIGSDNGVSNLKLVLADGRERALGLFGDAIRKMVEIFLVLLSNNSKVLFIDEVENGIHFTKHQEFWQKLFQISAELDIQIFATTHSLEMIQAFAEAAKGKYEDKAMYFEMAKAIDQNVEKLVAFSQDVESLFYAMEKGLAFRGEPMNYQKIKKHYL